jgi:hypothetical protein
MNAITPAYQDNFADSSFPSVDSIFERLSLINRWAGNLRFEYSALQHSILVAGAMDDPDYALYGLLHETPKAFFGDPRGWLSDQFNLASGNAFYQLKDQLLDRLYASIDIPPPPLNVKSMVAKANQIVNATEIRDVVADNPGLVIRDEFKPLSMTIQRMRRVNVIIQAKARYTMLHDDMQAKLGGQHASN